MTRHLTALAFVAALCAAAYAVPDDKVDRERLRKAAALPSVGPRGWYYAMACDGRLLEGGEDPARLDAAELRARTADDEIDPRRWLDLAVAYRRERSSDKAKDALEQAHALAARAASDQEDDGQPLAALGLVLAATGDDAGADKCVADAAQKKRGAWAGVAARGDLVVLRALAKASGSRFVSLDEAYAWLADDEERAKRVDGKLVAPAGPAYDEAVSLADAAGAKGQAGSSVYVRRVRFRSLLDALAGDDEKPEEQSRREARIAADHRRALELQADEPDAIAMTALDDAMSESEEDGKRHVLSYEELSEAALAKLVSHVDRLAKIAAGADAARGARALQGAAALHWFVRHDAAATEVALRRSITRDASLRQSWNAFVLVLADASRWDDLAQICAAWVETEDGARQRMMLAKALWASGDVAGAEKHWRAALALDPKSPEANLGVAVLVLRRAKDPAEIKEAQRLLGAAKEAVAARGGTPDAALAAATGLAEAVALGLSGDLDACEKAARRLLDEHGEFPQAREVLAAIGAEKH